MLREESCTPTCTFVYSVSRAPLDSGLWTLDSSSDVLWRLALRFHSVTAGMFPKGEADLVHHLMAKALQEVCVCRQPRGTE